MVRTFTLAIGIFLLVTASTASGQMSRPTSPENAPKINPDAGGKDTKDLLSGVPVLRPGAKIRLLQKQKKLKSSKEKGDMTIFAEVPVECTVVKSDASGMVIRWARGAMKFIDIDNDLVRKSPAMKAVVLNMVAAQAGPLIGATNDRSSICGSAATSVTKGSTTMTRFWLRQPNRWTR